MCLSLVTNDSHSVLPQSFSSRPENTDRVLLTAATARQRAWSHSKIYTLNSDAAHQEDAAAKVSIQQRVSLKSILPRDVLDAF